MEAWVYLLPAQGAWYEDVLSWLQARDPVPQIRTYRAVSDYLERQEDPRVGCVLADPLFGSSRGPALARLLAAQDDRLPVAFLSERPRIDEAVACLRAGAAHYLEWPLSVDAFTIALRELFEESKAITADRAQRRALEGRFASLSTRERQVLELIAEGSSSKDIAKRLGVSKRTVDYHRSQITSKVEVTNSIELVALALKLRHLHQKTGSGHVNEAPTAAGTGQRSILHPQQRRS